MWTERNERGIEGEPDCEGCKVELLPANYEAAKIFNKVRNQVLLYFNGETQKELDLNYVALDTVMNWYGVKDKRGVSEKVLRTYHELKAKREG